MNTNRPYGDVSHVRFARSLADAFPDARSSAIETPPKRRFVYTVVNVTLFLAIVVMAILLAAEYMNLKG